MSKISIIIITYNRLEELKETIQTIREEESEYHELVIVDNCSEDGTKEYGDTLNAISDKIKYYRLDENRGVAGGRNYAIQQSTGDILVFLDDDAIWETKNNLPRIREAFEGNRKLGCIAFKIINYYTHEIRREEYPFTDKTLSIDEPRLTSTYIGAGHALSRKVIDVCGLYPEDFMYGGEELDLSFRIINQGYEIMYDPKFAVLHKQVLKGRMKNDEKWIRVYRNRLIIGYKYLKGIYKIVSDSLWFIKILLITKSIRIPVCAVQEYRKVKNQLEKTTLTKDALAYMKNNYGRLWY